MMSHEQLPAPSAETVNEGIDIARYMIIDDLVRWGVRRSRQDETLDNCLLRRFRNALPKRGDKLFDILVKRILERAGKQGVEPELTRDEMETWIIDRVQEAIDRCGVYVRGVETLRRLVRERSNPPHPEDTVRDRIRGALASEMRHCSSGRRTPVQTFRDSVPDFGGDVFAVKTLADRISRETGISVHTVRSHLWGFLR